MEKGKLKIRFRFDKQDECSLLSALDLHGFIDGKLQPHDKRKIEQSFNHHNAAILYFDNKPIGFTTYTLGNNWAIIDYKWIVPEFQHQGFGRIFAKKVYRHLLRRNKVLMLVESASDKGLRLANLYRFQDLSSTDYKYSTRLQYLLLDYGRNQESYCGQGWELLIWPTYNSCGEPSYCYKLDDTLSSHPIIAIVNDDAAVQVRKDGKTVYSDKCKYFFDYPSEIQAYGLLYFKKNLSEILESKHIKLQDFE